MSETEARLLEHCRRYPVLTVQDMEKFLYQSSFGCEHLVSDPAGAMEYLHRELETCAKGKAASPEPLDGEFCRVHLEALPEGLTADTLGKLFLLSAEKSGREAETLEEKLRVFLKLTAEGRLPFSYAEANDAAEKWRSAGFPAVHHSQQFQDAYHPAYRVIWRGYAAFLPLLARLDAMLSHGSVCLAVEGGSASGKTTLARLLQQVYGCTVFHTDDFFLQPEQRTQERYQEPGGNMDRERFQKEVLEPLSRGETVQYRRFDCGSMGILPPVPMLPGRLNVIEGAYSMHPELERYYDFSVFLDVEPELQRRRILVRNTPEMAQMFFSRWIPLETAYFGALHPKERCDLVIPVSDEF